VSWKRVEFWQVPIGGIVRLLYGYGNAVEFIKADRDCVSFKNSTWKSGAINPKAIVKYHIREIVPLKKGEHYL